MSFKTTRSEVKPVEVKSQRGATFVSLTGLLLDGFLHVSAHGFD